jgi:superfamily II DNA or RNA helicase
MKAILSSYLYLPAAVAGDVRALKSRLTFTPRRFGRQDTKVREPIAMYDDRSHPGYIGVPREWGLDTYPDVEIEDRRSFGHPFAAPRLPSPDHPAVLDPVAQRRFMDEMLAMLEEFQSGGAHAGTGTGKTVVALRTAAKLGRTTLIIVHLERLMNQWVKEIHEKLGVPLDRIGIVQGEKCQFEGKDVVVAMVPSLCSRRYPDEFYRWPGTVIYDEAHKMGSAEFARSVVMFPAVYKLALSATWNRKDGGHIIFEVHVGPVRVVSEAEALPMDVYVVDYNAGKRVSAGGKNAHATLALLLARDNRRNEMIARQLVIAYQRGRTMLAVSDRTEQLQMIRNRVIALGVPEEETGLFVSQKYVMIDDPQAKGGKRKSKSKIDPAELARAQSKGRLIFATYGMMTEGIDIPRLDGGMDLTPRGQATQLVGRIRRPLPGKRRPIWMTIRDTCSVMALGYFKARLKDYLSTNVEVVYGNERNGSEKGPVLGGGAQRSSPPAISTGRDVSEGRFAAGTSDSVRDAPRRRAGGA